jgi:hypothetical protein
LALIHLSNLEPTKFAIGFAVAKQAFLKFSVLSIQAIARTIQYQSRGPQMAYLLERRTRIIFFTASSVNANGKSREIVIETRPEFAIVQLNGTKEQYPLPWEKIYEVALEHHEKNLRLEARAANATQRDRRRRSKKAS